MIKLEKRKVERYDNCSQEVKIRIDLREEEGSELMCSWLGRNHVND